MTTLTRYLVPCLTENINVISDYRKDPITVCPNNNEHTINPDGIMPLDSIAPKVVSINQNSAVSTGQNYLADFFELSVPAGTGATATYNISFDYNVSAYSITFLVSPDNIGDTFNVISLPNTVAGSITASLDIGSTNLSLPSVAGLGAGFNISISDGITTDNLGWIISVDEIANTIVFSNPTINAFDVGATVTFSIPRVRNGRIANAQNFGLGFSTLGSSGLLAGQIVQLNYINNSSNAKTLSFYVELQF